MTDVKAAARYGLNNLSIYLTVGAAVVMLSGCGPAALTEPAKTDDQGIQEETGMSDGIHETGPDGEAGISGGTDATDKPMLPHANHVTGDDADDDDGSSEQDAATESGTSGGKSLAERLCGRYTYLSGPGFDDDDEFYTMDVIAFGDNLYAFCGLAMSDGYVTDSLESYSFWATEFIPDKAADLQDTEADSVSVTALSFSIMSNAGMYWGPGERQTLTIVDDGLKFEGFGSDGFTAPDNKSGITFERDERAEATFAYLNDAGAAGDDDLQGYWVQDAADAPVYLLFDASNLYIYRKAPDSEVYFEAGGCEFKSGSFECVSSVLGSGDMPTEMSAEYSVDGDELVITFSEGIYSCDIDAGEKVTFKRTTKDRVHVTVMDEIRFNEDSFGMYGYEAAEDEYGYEDGFYGVWTYASRDRETALTEAGKLIDLGFDSYVFYSAEWEGLNSDGYYCVTAGRYQTEEDALAQLDSVKKAGFGSAYVKFSGKYIYN